MQELSAVLELDGGGVLRPFHGAGEAAGFDVGDEGFYLGIPEDQVIGPGDGVAGEVVSLPGFILIPDGNEKPFVSFGGHELHFLHFKMAAFLPIEPSQQAAPGGVELNENDAVARAPDTAQVVLKSGIGAGGDGGARGDGAAADEEEGENEGDELAVHGAEDSRGLRQQTVDRHRLAAQGEI